MPPPDRRPAIVNLETQTRVDRILDFLKNPPQYKSTAIYQLCWVDLNPGSFEIVAHNRAADYEEDAIRSSIRPTIRMTLADLKIARAQLSSSPENAAAIERSEGLIRDAIQTARGIKRKQRQGLWH